MEEEFKTLVESVSKEIQNNIETANKYLQIAVDLSKKHGIPFDSNISPISQSYKPNSYGALTIEQQDIISDVVEFDSNYYDRNGWQHSRAC